jgi:hypothetical protein
MATFPTEMTTDQLRVAEHVEKLIAQQYPEGATQPLLARVWDKVGQLYSSNPRRNGDEIVADACKAVRAEVHKSASRVTEQHAHSGDAEKPHVERDITRRRAAVQTQWDTSDSDEVVSDEGESYSDIIEKLANSRGQSYVLHHGRR